MTKLDANFLEFVLGEVEYLREFECVARARRRVLTRCAASINNNKTSTRSTTTCTARVTMSQRTNVWRQLAVHEQRVPIVDVRQRG